MKKDFNHHVSNGYLMDDKCHIETIQEFGFVLQ